ncbi:hypothetical protein VDGE_30165 [Verticillium dahliae]|uniref:Kelch repeat protein n=1 Tax=Verticillium dahliae TaxID=27337 RepID=A0A444S787_VERDA|nr:hypothetical protein VDGE_30165 [Verticillium dahliae]
MSAAFGALVQGQSTTGPSPDDSGFSRRIATGAAVLGDYIYVDGGLLVTQSGTATSNESSPYMLQIPANSSWSNDAISFNQLYYTGSPRNNYPDILTSSDGGKMISWGGVSTNEQANSSSEYLWTMQPALSGMSWNLERVDTTSRRTTAQRSAGSGAVVCNNTAFFIGGWVNVDTDPSVDVPRTTKIPKVTTSIATCLANYAESGIVIVLGGETGQTAVYKEGERYVAFDQVHIYSIHKDEWLKQETTGSQPSNRSHFCTVSANGTNGTTEIFVYGGFNSQLSEAYDDLYVLTIPGFHWTKVDYPSSSPRADHACVRAGGRQMVVIGGANLGLSSQEAVYEDVDPWANGLGVFDLVNLSWSHIYSSENNDYDTPTSISDWYAAGNMKQIEWCSDEVKDLFSGHYMNGRNAPPSKNSTITIITSVVGGVTGTVAAMAIVIMLVRPGR